MNRRKKGNQILKARAKRAKAKLAPKTKPRYISKAERAKMQAEAPQGIVHTDASVTDQISPSEANLQLGQSSSV